MPLSKYREKSCCDHKKKSKHTEIWTRLLHIQVLNVQKSFVENRIFLHFIAKKSFFFAQEGRVLFVARATAKLSSRYVTQTSEHKL